MMQIFDNAIRKSISGNPQYVLLKSLDYTTCEYGEKLLKYLLDGWNIAGKFINGVGYENYVLEDSKRIEILKHIYNIESENINAISIGISIFFDDLNRIENKKADIVFLNDGHKVDMIDIEDSGVDALRDILIFSLSAKQHTRSLITKLKKDFNK